MNCLVFMTMLLRHAIRISVEMPWISYSTSAELFGSNPFWLVGCIYIPYIHSVQNIWYIPNPNKNLISPKFVLACSCLFFRSTTSVLTSADFNEKWYFIKKKFIVDQNTNGSCWQVIIFLNLPKSEKESFLTVSGLTSIWTIG